MDLLSLGKALETLYSKNGSKLEMFSTIWNEGRATWETLSKLPTPSLNLTALQYAGLVEAVIGITPQTWRLTEFGNQVRSILERILDLIEE